MEIYYGKPFNHNAYVHKDTKKVLNIFTAKNTFKIINFHAAFPNLNFDTSSSVKPIKNYM